MSKIEVTETQVDLAAALLGHGSPHNREDVRRALEAALNPPPDPEIVVTEEMKRAGAETIRNQYGYTPDFAEKIYRAMRKLEPYDPLAKQGQMQSRRKNDGGGSGSGNCDR